MMGGMPNTPSILTTVVGSYPVPAWLAAMPSTPALNDAILVRQAAQADAHVVRVELDDVHAGNRRVQRIGARGDHVVRLLDRAGVWMIGIEAVRGADHDRSARGAKHRWFAARGERDHGDSTTRHRRERQAGGGDGAGTEEIAARD